MRSCRLVNCTADWFELNTSVHCTSECADVSAASTAAVHQVGERVGEDAAADAHRERDEQALAVRAGYNITICGAVCKANVQLRGVSATTHIRWSPS